MRAPTSILEVAGTQFAIAKQGSGPPIIFVHGSASDYRTWSEQIDRQSKTHNAIAYSRRFHWPNEPIAEGEVYDIARHVDDLEAIIDALDIGPANLVGHSYGAFVSILLALRRPELVRSLVLAEPPIITLFLSLPPKIGELLRLALTRPRTAATVVGFAARGIEPAKAAIRRGELEKGLRIHGVAVLGEKFFKNLSPSRQEQVQQNLIVEEFLGPEYPVVARPSLHRIRTPILLLRGQQSPAIFHCIMDELAGLLPAAQSDVIARASHIMHEDNSADFETAVTKFLSPITSG
ncbi:MAG: alpha/beta hydrolase [Hyphomonadaceae bacterium]|nr:alpha/beta hydrolase [Hyphomonadaceae bacterium]